MRRFAIIIFAVLSLGIAEFDIDGVPRSGKYTGDVPDIGVHEWPGPGGGDLPIPDPQNGCFINSTR